VRCSSECAGYGVCGVFPWIDDIARDYGGYGFRSARGGKAYVASGGRGVRVTLAGGEKLVVGSERPDELARMLHPS
jgi:hypothetical protein